MPLALCGQKKEFNEKISKEIVFEQSDQDNILVLKNIFGSIVVEGYNGDKILLEVDKTIRASTEDNLALGKNELQLKVFSQGNEIIAHPDAPYIRFNQKGLKFDWCGDNYQEPKYQHQMNFRVKVPKNIKLDISTINDGEVVVKNMKGKALKVSNINGGIELANVSGVTDLNCINGDVNITYVDNPSKDSRYYSLNGDINVSYQNGLSANVSFKTMNGELFTEFDVERQFTETKKTNESVKGKFKFEATPKLQIGNGDIALDFETLNGNVFIKKI